MGNYNVEEAEEKSHFTKYRLFPSSRSSVTLAAFFGCVCIYLMRVNLSVAIVCMTNDDEIPSNSTLNATTEASVVKNTWLVNSYMWTYDSKSWDSRSLHHYNEEDVCPGEEGGDNDSEQEGQFDWDRQQRGTINSSFFWGYVLTQLLGGLLAMRYGVKIVLGTGVVIQIIATLLSPPAANVSPYALMAMRFIKGLGSGVFFPCTHHLAAEWSPGDEKSLHLNIIMSGTSWGSLVSFALSGVLCADLGWEWVFWMYAIAGSIWFVFWLIYAFDTPEKHPRICMEELEYITQSQGIKHDQQDGQKTPWRHILTSPCVIAIYISHFCNNWGGYTILTSLPQYMKDVLKVNIEKNGLFNSLPHLLKFITTILFGILADILISRRIMGARATRNLMQTLACVIPSILLVAVGYLDCFSTSLVVTCITLAEGFAAGNRAGGLTNILDIAPRYAGLLMGVSNTIANFAGIFAPIVTASLTPNGLQEEWRNVFFLTAGLYMFSWVVFMIFSKGDLQPWAKADYHLEKSDDLVLEVDNKDYGSQDNTGTNGLSEKTGYANTAFMKME